MNWGRGFSRKTPSPIHFNLSPIDIFKKDEAFLLHLFYSVLYCLIEILNLAAVHFCHIF